VPFVPVRRSREAGGRVRGLDTHALGGAINGGIVWFSALRGKPEDPPQSAKWQWQEAERWLEWLKNGVAIVNEN